MCARSTSRKSACSPTPAWSNRQVHKTGAELEAGLDHVRESPVDGGTLDLIVVRPAPGERLVLESGELDLELGLLGNDWHVRPTKEGPPDPLAQLNIMNSRAAALVAGSRERMPLAGDQLYVDLDISVENLPAGTRLALGSAVIEVTPEPHTGCVKFMSRFGKDAHRFVNTKPYRHLRLRGLNAKVVQPGTVAAGDTIRKL